MPDLTQMSKVSTEVDTDLNAVDDGGNVALATESAEINQSQLKNLFRESDEETVEDRIETEETEDTNVLEDDEPVGDSLETSDLEEEESSQAEDDNDEEEEDSKDSDDEPEWFKKRIDKLTSQRKQAWDIVDKLEKRVKELESKEEKDESSPFNVNSIDDPTELEDLEKRAIQAQDEVDDLLETDPKYDDDGEAYWIANNKRMTRKELIEIRKNARNTERSIPKRREYLRQKTAIDKETEKLPYFSDPENPLYDLAQETLNSEFYRTIRKFPEAKAIVSLMMDGYIFRAAQKQKTDKKDVKVPAKETFIKSSPKGKAAGDTGTSVPEVTPQKSYRKKLEKAKNQGGISQKALATFF